MPSVGSAELSPAADSPGGLFAMFVMTALAVDLGATVLIGTESMLLQTGLPVDLAYARLVEEIVETGLLLRWTAHGLYAGAAVLLLVFVAGGLYRRSR